MRVTCIQILVAGVLTLVLPHLLFGEELELRFKEASWFTDEVATAYILLNTEGEPELDSIDSNDEIRIYSSEVVALKDDDPRGSHAVVVEFVPRRVGIRTFPSLRLTTGDSTWKSGSKQFVASETLLSDRMSLEMNPHKEEIMQGEPLRIDFAWKSDLPVSQLRAFRLIPSFFNNPDIKVYVPRIQVPADDQFGLPVGGKRVIAHRIQGRGMSESALGEVRFSIWVKFEAAGRYEFSETELYCSLLEDKGYGSHQYASYFNNSLFESVDRSKSYKKLKTRSAAHSIEVLPLAEEGRLESFSGLFSPESIEVTVTPSKLELGQLMEIRVDVKSDVCSEMLELSPISLQRSLRHRFWVAESMSETWLPDGRRFVARGRPISTELGYFPSLSFQVVDLESGGYRTIETASIPLSVSSEDGQSYFPLKGLPGTKQLIESSKRGVWYNDKGNVMSDLAHGLISVLVDGFWLFLLLGPLLYFVLRPWVRERRRRFVDKLYGKRRAAYLLFLRRASEVKENPDALHCLIADCLERPVSSLTPGDVGELLSEQGCDQSIVDGAVDLLRGPEERLYSGKEQRVGERDFDANQRSLAIGKTIYRTLVKGGAVLAIAVGAGSVSTVEAASWAQAESAFSEALDVANSGAFSSRIEEAFSEAALEFESCASEGIRPGPSWYNAGNAWFKAGEIGRAIASYRKAEAYRPFDERLQESLAAARALRVDEFMEQRSRAWPTRWVLAGIALLWVLSWLGLLFWQRFRTRVLLIVSGLGLTGSCVLGAGEMKRHLVEEQEGVLIAEEAFGRKGPSFAYQSAFLEPLHSGLELRILEAQENWLRVSIGTGDECWLPQASVEAL